MDDNNRNTFQKWTGERAFVVSNGEPWTWQVPGNAGMITCYGTGTRFDPDAGSSRTIGYTGDHPGRRGCGRKKRFRENYRVVPQLVGTWW